MSSKTSFFNLIKYKYQIKNTNNTINVNVATQIGFINTKTCSSKHTIIHLRGALTHEAMNFTSKGEMPVTLVASSSPDARTLRHTSPTINLMGAARGEWEILLSYARVKIPKCWILWLYTQVKIYAENLLGFKSFNHLPEHDRIETQ